MTDKRKDEMSKCGICGEPMPAGEEMFKYHGYSGNCPRPLISKAKLDVVVEYYLTDEINGEFWIIVYVNRKPYEQIGFPTKEERDIAYADLLDMQRSSGSVDVKEN